MISHPILDVTHLRTEYRSPRGIVVAVDDVSFHVGRGEMVGILGESGCGKSTAARSILRLIRPPGRIVGGSIMFDGEDLLAMKPDDLRRTRGRRIGLIPQNPFAALNPVLTVERQFLNALRAHESSRKDRHASVGSITDILQEVGMRDIRRVLRSYPHELSGGMAQRSVIALTMVLGPELVIADEPTTGLDVTVQRQVLDLVASLFAGGQRSMLLVTHDLGVVAQYCMRVIVMYAGQVVEIGPVHEVMTRPGHPYTRMLIKAVPREGRDLVSIDGSPPDLIDPPLACPFHARCDRRDDPRCATERPSLREVSDGHFVRSFYAA